MGKVELSKMLGYVEGLGIVVSVEEESIVVHHTECLESLRG